MARKFILIVVGTTAIVLTLASATLLFVLAASSLAKRDGQSTVLLASAIVEVATCLPWTLLLIRCCHVEALLAHECRARGLTRGIVLPPLCVLVLSLGAGAVVGAAIAQLTKRHQIALAERSVNSLPATTVVIWSVSVLAQGAFFASFALALKGKTKRTPPQQRFAIDDAPQEMIEASRPATAMTIQSNPFGETTLASSAPLSASDGDSSLRSSFSTIQRPGSSKRALLIRSHSQPRQSARSSSDGPSRRPSQDEGFDNWDTSGVSPQMRETVLQSKPLGKGTGLPTIPGSRSPSPAKALEGPFFDPSPDDSPPQSPLPQPPVSRQTSPPSSPLELPNFGVHFASSTGTAPSSPPSSSTTQKHNFSRPPSLTVARSSEDHIHPLFRTSSPTPPPSTSSNTIVTAAPEAGQFINQRTFQRLRSGSLPPTSTPLLRSESSPDISDAKFSCSPMSVNMPSHASSPRQGALHQRKRSASFETAIIRD
ncbi:MAG: hypothetical protein Q9217_005921 [Psora testacea]